MNQRTTTACLIVNPRAGRGDAAGRAREVERFCEHLRGHGIHIELHETKGTNDAARLASEATRDGRIRDVIVSGGDGTIHEALQGLVGADVRLAVWPAGTANVLARQLNLPFDALDAAAVFARGRTRRITLGCATDERTEARRYFFMMAGIGLDASVVRHVRPALKRRVGELAYWYAGLGHLAHWHPSTFNLEVDGRIYPATYAAIGKAPRYGGGLALTPRARLDSHEFEVCIINSRSRLRYLQLLAAAMRGGAREDARRGDVRYISTSRLRAVGVADVQADGELIGSLPLTFEIVPGGIEIVVP